MAREKDIFELASDEERLVLMQATCRGIFGDKKGDEIFERVEQCHNYALRQPGDAVEPENNFWKGRWRVYEAK